MSPCWHILYICGCGGGIWGTCRDCVGALSFVFPVKFKVKFSSCPLMFRAEYKDCGAGEQHLQSGTTSNWYLNI